MGRKKKNSPLDEALNMMGYDNHETGEGTTDMDNQVFEQSSVDDLSQENDPDPDEDAEDKRGTEDPHEDTSEIPEEVLNKINNASDSNDEEPIDEAGEDPVEDQVDPGEAQQIGAFFDAFAEALNWDVQDDDKPNSIEGLIQYIGDVVEQNSTPHYADSRIEQLDAYVKNGGRFEDFYGNQSQLVSYDTLDLEDESNQKAVVRDYMRIQGYNDEQIDRKIERYEDADMLEDEAADAVTYLKRVREAELERAQQQQEQIRMQQEQQAMEFITNLNSSIANLDNIRGISVPKEDRKALLDYITRTDENGLTQYQKDFNQNMVENLIESAYFTMKGDALLGTAQRKGQTSAASKLRNMLKHQSKNHTTYGVREEKAPQAWEIASKFL